MKVEHDHGVDARVCADMIQNAGANRCPRLVKLVALRIVEIGDHRGDGSRARALECIKPERELDELIVGWEEGRLHDEDVAPAHVLIDPDEDATLREAQHCAGAWTAPASVSST